MEHILYAIRINDNAYYAGKWRGGIHKAIGLPAAHFYHGTGILKGVLENLDKVEYPDAHIIRLDIKETRYKPED